MALCGGPGAGKTWTSLALATGLGHHIALIDTESGSARKYAGDFDFDVCELESFHPQYYIDGMVAAYEAGYDVLIVDSLSHAWAGKDGALELGIRHAPPARIISSLPGDTSRPFSTSWSTRCCVSRCTSL